MKLFQVDSFTDVPFRGNPAGVCVLTGEEAARVTDNWMQCVAMEMNLSETAFLVRKAGGYSLRWFTPAVEVDICGHATLASAHILWSEHFEPENEDLKFETRSGLLGAAYDRGWITLDFPSDPPEQADPPAGLLNALYPVAGPGAGSNAGGMEGAPAALPLYFGKTKWDWFVRVPDEEAVRGARPNMEALAQLTGRGVVITAQAAADAGSAESGSPDFVSRFFAPAAGIPEDPVTGSAHCCLGPYWGKVLNKNRLTGFQASARGGTVKVEVKGGRTLLSGKALTIFELSPRQI